MAIINETLARRLWPNGDPLDDRLLMGRTLDPAYDKDPVRQIVGIVDDVRDVALNRSPRPIMYVPAAQLPDGVKALSLPLLPVAWMIRTHGSPVTLRNAIQNELRLAGGGLPVARIRGLDEVAAESTARTRMNALLMMFFGCAALLLASVGIYGLMAYSVEQRRPRSESGWRWELRHAWFGGWWCSKPRGWQSWESRSEPFPQAG